MKNKKEIVRNWLPRYTGVDLEDFGNYILVTNFQHYVNLFSEMHDAKINGKDKPMPSCTANDITIINYGIGSPNAALVVDLLTAVKPKAVLFLGKCGGLKKKNKLGDFILPLAAIRGEGTSNDYLPPEIPALPAFALQKAVSSVMNRTYNRDYWSGTVYTVNRRVWEHDERFKKRLRKSRAMAIDMETATIFIAAFYNGIPAGALLLVTDQPMIPEGIKTSKSDKKVTEDFVPLHVKIGISALEELRENKVSVKHLHF